MYKSQYFLNRLWFSASKWHFPSPYWQSKGAWVFSILCQSGLVPLCLNTNWLSCFSQASNTNLISPIVIFFSFLSINNQHCILLRKGLSWPQGKPSLVLAFQEQKSKKFQMNVFLHFGCMRFYQYTGDFYILECPGSTGVIGSQRSGPRRTLKARSVCLTKQPPEYILSTS